MARKGSAVHICSFSVGLDGLTKHQQGQDEPVLQVLQGAGRFSVFEATDNPTIAKKMTSLVERGLIVVDNESVGYPWSKVSLTDAGRFILRAHPHP